MNLLKFFSQKQEIEGADSNVGKFECEEHRLADVFTQLMEKMGMTNPAKYANTANKAVTIKKEGNKYVIYINTFTPPLKITWTDPFLMDSLTKVIDRLVIEENKKIGYLNITKTTTEGNQCQLALA